MSVPKKTMDSETREVKVTEKKKSETFRKKQNTGDASKNPLSTNLKLVNRGGIVYIEGNYNGNLVYFKQDIVEPKEEYRVPYAVTNNAAGTVTGDIDDIKSLNDGNTLTVAEVAANPGFDVEIDFVRVKRLRGIAANFNYDGGVSGHNVTVDIYNYTTSSWDSIIAVTSSSVFSYRYIEIPDGRRYFNNLGNAKLRFYHNDTGNALHDIVIDYVALLI